MANSDISAAKEQVQRQREAIQRSRQQLQTSKSRLPDVTSQQSLRTQDLQGKIKRQKVLEVGKGIAQQQEQLESEERQVSAYEKNISSYEQQLKQVQEDSQAYELAKSFADTGQSLQELEDYVQWEDSGGIRAKAKSYLKQFIKQGDMAEIEIEKRKEEIADIRKSIPEGDKLILDRSGLNIVGVESKTFVMTLSPEAYNLKIQEFNKQLENQNIQEFNTQIQKIQPQTFDIPKQSVLSSNIPQDLGTIDVAKKHTLPSYFDAPIERAGIDIQRLKTKVLDSDSTREQGQIERTLRGTASVGVGVLESLYTIPKIITSPIESGKGILSFVTKPEVREQVSAGFRTQIQNEPGVFVGSYVSPIIGEVRLTRLISKGATATELANLASKRPVIEAGLFKKKGSGVTQLLITSTKESGKLKQKGLTTLNVIDLGAGQYQILRGKGAIQILKNKKEVLFEPYTYSGEGIAQRGNVIRVTKNAQGGYSISEPLPELTSTFGSVEVIGRDLMKGKKIEFFSGVSKESKGVVSYLGETQETALSNKILNTFSISETGTLSKPTFSPKGNLIFRLSKENVEVVGFLREIGKKRKPISIFNVRTEVLKGGKKLVQENKRIIDVGIGAGLQAEKTAQKFINIPEIAPNPLFTFSILPQILKSSPVIKDYGISGILDSGMDGKYTGADIGADKLTDVFSDNFRTGFSSKAFPTQATDEASARETPIQQPASDVLLRTDTKIKSLQQLDKGAILQSKNDIILGNRLNEQFKPMQETLQIQRPAQAQIQIQRPAQAQIQIQRPIQTQKTITEETPIIPRQQPQQLTPKIIIPKIDLSKSSKKSPQVTEPSATFEIFVKRKGKDIQTESAKNIFEAASILRKELKKSLAASGFVESGGKKVSINLGAEFTPSKVDPLRIVQKRSSRLGTFQERKEIQKAKKQKPISWLGRIYE